MTKLPLLKIRGRHWLTWFRHKLLKQNKPYAVNTGIPAADVATAHAFSQALLLSQSEAQFHHPGAYSQGIGAKTWQNSNSHT
jgi:hypothetical protein